MAAGTTSTSTTGKEIPASGDKELRTAIGMLEDWGLVPSIKPEFNVKGAYSKVVAGVLKLISAHKGKISCILNCKPPVLNGIGRLHGLVVASVSERVAIGCAKTVVGKDKDLFLGELSVSYLSSAPRDAEVAVDASVVKSGRNMTIVALSFRDEESRRLLYLSRATLYHMPVSSL